MAITPEQYEKYLKNKELQEIEEFLKSERGREKIRKAQEDAEETCKIIEEAQKIDPEILKIPFGPIAKPNNNNIFIPKNCFNIQYQYEHYKCEKFKRNGSCTGCPNYR